MLRLEITESAFANSAKGIVEIVKQLIEKGFTVEIDDFGSGYSSLNTLKNVPAQVLKLDMHFLEDDDDSDRGGNILESIVRMAKWLGMSVIAEGVEYKAQADYLASIGCSYIQGYLYARPMPAEEYEKYCKNAGKEERLLSMTSAPNLNNNSFWDPKSMDTLIFNSFVGAACIFEYHDRNIELLRVNDKFTVLLGSGTMTVEETLRLNWISCLTPDSLAHVRNILALSAQSGEEYTAEYCFKNITEELQLIWLRSTMRVIATAGERMLVYCMSENITGQKESLERERLAAEQVQLMIHDMPGGYARMRVEPDGALSYVFFNDNYCTMHGMTHAEMEKAVKGDILDAVHPDDLTAMKEAISKLLADEGADSLRFRAHCRSGGYKWFSVLGRLTRDKDGHPFINAYFSDIDSEVKEQANQRAMLDNLPGGAGIYEFKDGQMDLIYQNKSYWDLVGLNCEAYPDPNSMSAVHPDDIPVIMQDLGKALAENRDVVCDIRLRHLTLGYRYVHLVGRIVVTGDNAFNIFTTFTPITEEALSIQKTLPIAIQAMMDASSDIAFIKGKDLRYISCSRQFALLTGHKSEKELIGKCSSDIVPEALAAENSAIDIEILSGGGSVVDKDTLLPTADGVRHLIFSKYPLFDTAGSVIGIYGTGHDVTEALKQQSRLELLANNIPGGLAVYEGRPDALDKIKLAYFSDGFCRLYGYTREEYTRLSQVNPLSLVAASDITRMFDSIVGLVRDGIPMDLTYRALVNGDKSKWINVKAVMGEPNGDKLTVNAVFTDLTAQKNVLDKLRISEEINRIALEQSRTVVCRYDVASHRLITSPNIDPIFGIASVEENVPERNVQNGVISPESVEDYKNFYAKIQTGEKHGRVMFQRNSSIGWRWIDAHFTTIFTDRGEPSTAVISFADVTDSIERDMAYRKWKQSLLDRTPESYSFYHCNISKDTVISASEGLLIPIEIKTDALSLSERTAKYAGHCVYGEDRNQFLSVMSRGTLLLRYNKGRRSDALEYREMLPDGGVRWVRVTLDLSESPTSADIEAYVMFEDIDEVKRAELNIIERAETDSLTGLLNRVTFEERFARRIGKRKPGTVSALFIIDLDGFKLVNDRFGHAVGDQTLIELGQKLLSAFRDEDLICRLGGDEFLIYMCGALHRSAIKERASLVCALLHKSFSLDIQLSASIGISICPDNGSDFETLYRKADSALYYVKETGKDNYAVYSESMSENPGIPQTENAPEAVSRPAAHNAPTRRMLIVEDNEINRDYLSSLFDSDFIIDTASEGTAALIRLRRYGSGISVVLLDLMMPGLDGFEVLKKMRENVSTQNIPVIVVSGMDEREACLKAIKEGASDFITKPVDPDILKLRVASVLSRSENEQLRAQNRYLALQNDEAKRLAEAKRHSEELSVALHAAERADLAKSQFLSSMSHEIRTPLNAVIGYNTIAKNEMNEARTDEERRQSNMKVLDCLTKSEVASRHLLTIINDVLDMSAIESGKMKVDNSDFDFRSLITSLTVMFFSQARSKGVDFEVIFDKPTEEWFVGDQLRINQVLTNLLSNAVKFTPDGGHVSLIITESIIDDFSAHFKFVVTDTGIGMTEEYLEHIWTPFEQAEASISRRFGGTGLGLSITKNLVSLMNGSIDVESKPGAGSRFTVELTLGRTGQPQQTSGYDFSHVNALVVDDDMNTCDYIKLLFDRCGARCSVFTSGRQAIDAFDYALKNKEPYNICLVDWRMPQMDGFSTISEIQRLSAGDLPIVVVSAYDFSEVAEHAKALGISRFISKPLFQSSLFDLLVTISGKPVPVTHKPENKYNFDGARVLLAEDNNMNMEVARHLLVSAGLAVDSAWNGQEAIDIFTASRPGAYKAILMDVHMPVADGYQATRAIRASEHPDAKSVPIIAMTADVFAEDVAEAHSAGMNDHIAKPIDVESLYHMLKEYIQN